MAGREPMSSVDRAWLMMDDPTNPMVINGFWIFEKPLQYEHVLAVLEERLLIYPRFRQRVVEYRVPSGPAPTGRPIRSSTCARTLDASSCLLRGIRKPSTIPCLACSPLPWT